MSSQCHSPLSLIPPGLFPEHLYKTMLLLTVPGQEGVLFFISSTELPVSHAAPLIGCWAAVTSSNNDSYLVENTDGKTKRSDSWFLLFLAWHRYLFPDKTAMICVRTSPNSVMGWLVSDQVFFFLMMLGFSFVRRHFALWGGFCNSRLDEVNICKSNHQNFNQLCLLAYKTSCLSFTFYDVVKDCKGGVQLVRFFFFLTLIPVYWCKKATLWRNTVLYNLSVLQTHFRRPSWRAVRAHDLQGIQVYIKMNPPCWITGRIGARKYSWMKWPDFKEHLWSGGAANMVVEEKGDRWRSKQ